MPWIPVNGAELYYEDIGGGPQTVVFAHGLLLSGRTFSAQVAALRSRYRCITFDFRGQGRSVLAKSGYDMDTLTADTAALLQALQAAPCHFVGLSMGGYVGLRLALRHPQLLRTLTLAATSADADTLRNRVRLKLLTWMTRWLGVRLTVGPSMAVLFGRRFRSNPARAAERAQWRQHLLANDPTGLCRAAQGVLSRPAVYEEIHKIAVPTLILVGDRDVTTEPARSQRLHQRIASSRLLILPDVGHCPPVEEPAAVNAALLEFLTHHPGTSSA